MAYNKIFVLFNPAPGGRGASAIEFTTLSEARSAASLWLEQPNAYDYYLWNGSSWEYDVI